MFAMAQPLMLGVDANRPATYVTSGKRNGAADSTTLTLTGAAVGDMVVLIAATSSATISGGDGGWEASSSPLRRLTKQLTAGDLAATLTCGAYPWAFAVYRKPRSVEQASSASLSNTDLIIPGFTKDSRSAGVIAALHTSGPNTAITTPSGWTKRQSALDGAAFSYEVVEIYDLLSPGTYTDSATVTFTPGTGKTMRGELVELLNSSGGGGGSSTAGVPIGLLLTLTKAA